MQNYHAIFVFFVLLFISTLSLSQESLIIDSLKTDIEQHIGDKEVAYNRIADEYFYYSNDSCLKYANLAYDYALLHSNLYEQAVALEMLGSLEIISAFNQNALNYYFKSVKIANLIKDTSLMAILYNNIGVAYMDLEDFDNSEKYLELSILFKDVDERGNPYNNLGLIYQNNGKFDLAIEYYNKAIESYNLESNKYGLANAIANIGIIYREQKDYEKAKELLFQALYIYQQSNNKLNEATVIVNIGMVFSEEKLIDSALYYFDAGLAISKANNYYEVITETYYNMSLLYEDANDYEKAIYYYKEHYNIHDSLFAVKKQKQIEELHSKYDIAKKNETIELLSKDNEYKAEREWMQKTWLIVMISLVSLLVLLTILVYFMKRNLYISDINLVEKNIEIASSNINIKKKEINLEGKRNSNIKLIEELKYSESALTEEQMLEIYLLIKSALEEDKVFLEIDFTIVKLSDYLNVNRTYLSRIINEMYNKNFNTLINEYRVIEARDMLIGNNKYTIAAIASEVGFGSKSSFNTAFKKYTGLTPSFFIKNTKAINK